MFQYNATLVDAESGVSWCAWGAITGTWPFTDQLMRLVQIGISLASADGADCEVMHLVITGDDGRQLVIHWPTSDGVAEWYQRAME